MTCIIDELIMREFNVPSNIRDILEGTKWRTTHI